MKQYKVRILVAVVSLLMIFGNVANPLSGAFYAYALEDEETAIEAAEAVNDADENANDADENADTADGSSDDQSTQEEDAAASDDGDAGDSAETEAAGSTDPADAADSMAAESAPAEEAAAAFNGAVYVDGVNGNDDNDGLSKETAVKTWDKAKEIIGSNAGTIYVCGTLTVSGEVSTADPSNQVVKRTSDFNGLVFKVDTQKKDATFKDIHFDGEGRSVLEPVVLMKGCNNGSLKFLENAVFENNKNDRWNVNHEGSTDGASKTRPQGGAVSVFSSDGTKLLIDGASFLNNTAAFEGGAIFLNGKIETVIKAGTFKGNKANKGSVIVNYNSTSDNQITIYNALITGNTSKGNAGGINICQSNISETTISGDESTGAAIFGNTGPDGDIAVWDNSDRSKLKINEGTMLGGGNHHWVGKTDYGYEADLSKISKDDIANTELWHSLYLKIMKPGFVTVQFNPTV